MPATTNPETALVAVAPSAEYSIVRPVVTPEEAVTRFREYQQLEAILSDDDYFYFVEWQEWYNGKPSKKQLGFEKKGDAEDYASRTKGAVVKRRKKKSACRKLATFFNLGMPIEAGEIKGEYQEVGPYIVEKISGQGYIKTVWHKSADLAVVKAEVTVWIQAPNGRTQIGDGVCSTAERGFKNANHDIPTTAFTRALNRAILDLVGFGEVSAEEIASGASQDDEKPAKADGAGRGKIAQPWVSNEEMEPSPADSYDPLRDVAPPDADPPDYPKIKLTLTDGHKTRPLTKYEALPYFAKIKTAVGDQMYYAIMGGGGYEHANELPTNKVESVYAELVAAYKAAKDTGEAK
jgi:hypothetical protein